MCPTLKALLLALCATALLVPACKHAREDDAVAGLPTSAERIEREGALDAQRAAFDAAQLQRASAPVSGYVLLPHGTTLYSSEGQARSSAGQPPESRAIADFPVDFDVSAYQVIEDRGDVVHVRFLSAPEVVYHCVDASVHPLTSRVDLSAWVHKRSLVPVLTKPFIRQFEDASAYGFMPGVPAWPARQTPEVSHVLDAQGLQVAVDDSEAEPLALALSYQDPGKPTTLQSDELSLPLDVMLWIDREPIMRASELSPLMRRIVQQREHDSQTMMVALGDACMQVAALIPRSDVTRATREQLSPVMLLGSKDPEFRKPRAVSQRVLFWPDGREAGKLLHPTSSLPGEENMVVSERSGMRCVDVPLHLSEPLCLKESK